ncbi:hypothetical protein C815_00681 [Firmicutes bacterium M10-2]|nr:hypothetical protein C815_00681 [Firmicutes bacterium M10-2]
MKGLFVKDFYIALQNKILLLLSIVLVAVMLTILRQSIYFIVPYLSFMLITDALGTISYDEYNNGFKALFTLPFTRSQYVQEKYILVLIAGILIPFAFCVIAVLCSSITFSELTLLLISMLTLTVFMGAIAIPCYLKFGIEKGKMVNLAILMFTIMIINFLSDPEILLSQQALFQNQVVLWLIIAIMLILLALSYRVAITIMNRKEL